MKRRTWTRPIHITLSCGCTVKARLSPLNTRATYGCNSGLSHGYQLAWTSWTDGTSTNPNRDLAADTTRSPR